MNNMYLIPANTKRGMLIFNVFRTSDLILFGTGVLISLILLVTIAGSSIIWMLVKLGPALITGLLVLPIPHYHNFLSLLKDLYAFYMNRRVFLWKGWCATYGAKE